MSGLRNSAHAFWHMYYCMGFPETNQHTHVYIYIYIYHAKSRLNSPVRGLTSRPNNHPDTIYNHPDDQSSATATPQRPCLPGSLS